MNANHFFFFVCYRTNVSIQRRKMPRVTAAIHVTCRYINTFLQSQLFLRGYTNDGPFRPGNNYLHSNRGLHKSITHVMYLRLSSESLSLLEIVDHKQYTSHLFDNAYQVELISTPGITADTHHCKAYSFIAKTRFLCGTLICNCCTLHCN